MKEFICHYCNEYWCVNEEKEDNVTVCPFCAQKVYKPKNIIVCSFETAIHKVIADMSTEILKERKRFISYLMDIGMDYRKEIHILSKACDSNAFSKLYTISKMSYTDAKSELARFKHLLIEEEGISEAWAKLICDSFMRAIFSENIDGNTDEIIPVINSTVKSEQQLSVAPNIIQDTVGLSQIIERLSRVGISVGESISFGCDNWKVLDIAVDSVWLLCDVYSQKHAFHSECKKTTWNTCALRRWLNDEFIKRFSHNDVKYILDTEVKTSVDSKSFPNVSEITTDKVFILDIDEFEKYKSYISTRYHGWLLRSPSPQNGHDFVVTCEGGKVYLWGVRVDYATEIKPVIRLSLDYFVEQVRTDE